jgi:fumarate hydratase subunit beta
MIKLSFPFTEEKIRSLKVGDEVLISGVVFTGRGAVKLASVFRWR